ncbi:hypothetical protein CAP2UW1_3049 [Candidatus Accumulibacter phosphatis]|uniref:Uncharacterized protein n=1 Tax=Accumulibacter regalis TaxID=522306 RepID=C7RUS9_ACCRE
MQRKRNPGSQSSPPPPDSIAFHPGYALRIPAFRVEFAAMLGLEATENRVSREGSPARLRHYLLKKSHITKGSRP